MDITTILLIITIVLLIVTIVLLLTKKSNDNSKFILDEFSKTRQELSSSLMQTRQELSNKLN